MIFAFVSKTGQLFAVNAVNNFLRYIEKAHNKKVSDHNHSSFERTEKEIQRMDDVINF